MPSDFLVNTICLRNWPDMTLHEVVRPIGLLSPHRLAGEDVIVIRCVNTLTTPAEKILCHVAVHRDRFGGGFCLAERVTQSSRFSKSTSLQRSANNSLTRSPVPAYLPPRIEVGRHVLSRSVRRQALCRLTCSRRRRLLDAARCRCGSERRLSGYSLHVGHCALSPDTQKRHMRHQRMPHMPNSLRLIEGPLLRFVTTYDATDVSPIV